MLHKERTNVYDFNYHLVFVTKYRKQVFTTPRLQDDLKNILINIMTSIDYYTTFLTNCQHKLKSLQLIVGY